MSLVWLETYHCSWDWSISCSSVHAEEGRLTLSGTSERWNSYAFNKTLYFSHLRISPSVFLRPSHATMQLQSLLCCFWVISTTQQFKFSFFLSTSNFSTIHYAVGACEVLAFPLSPLCFSTHAWPSYDLHTAFNDMALFRFPFSCWDLQLDYTALFFLLNSSKIVLELFL